MLITTIEKMKEYVPVIAGNDFNKYKTFVQEASEWLKKEIVGSALYDVLSDPGNEALKGYAESIVANKAYLLGLPFFDLVETENGFAVVNTTTLAPASRERVNALQQGVEKWLSDGIERILEYLEETIQYHEAWKGSPTYTLLTETYIHTLKEFRRYAPFDGNRIEFIRNLPAMLDVINLKIEPVISSELSEEIIEQLRDNDLTPANIAILKKLRFAFANFVAGKEDAAQTYLMKVRKVILTSPDIYPAFKNSALYSNILATVIEKNSETKTLFRAGF